jgi:hypothetical protein
MLADRVSQTTTTTGTGTYDLIDPPSGQYLSAVASVGSGNRLIYLAQADGVWEICWGVVTAGSPATLTRNLIRSSTGSLINWAPGTKSISSIAQADLVRFGARGLVPTSAGTANAQTVTHATPLRIMLAGMEAQFLPGNTNTGAATLNVDGLGATAVVRPDGAACIGGELRSGHLARAVYDGTSWRLVTLPAAPLPTNSAGVGQVVAISSPSSGAAVVAPTGGTWDCFVTGFDAATGGTNFQFAVGVYGSGATIISSPGVIFAGRAHRIT